MSTAEPPGMTAPSPPLMPTPQAPPPPPETVGVGLLIAAALLALCGAALLALSMVVQRYALAHPGPRVKMLCWKTTRMRAWVVGLVIYGVANGVYAAALSFGPLSVLGSLFTTLLVFNMIFARYMLGEELEPPRVIGALIILIGATCCAVSTPVDIETVFSPDEIAELFQRPEGITYICILFGLVLASVASILIFERHYPNSHDGSNLQPPIWLAHVMAILYPASLGMDEGLAQIMMRSSVSMYNYCGEHGIMECHHWTVYVTLLLWIAFSIPNLWWFKVVFQRYEVTVALPIEYGAVNVCAICSGLIFFNEAAYFNSWQLPLMISGGCIIMLGIGISRVHCGGAQALKTSTCGVVADLCQAGWSCPAGWSEYFWYSVTAERSSPHRVATVAVAAEA
uniref:Magnesium transporter n=1 Tax=Chrysotila carterae TaxID=13221 RepID=A0A7S4F4V2_CHRCT